MDDLAPWLRAQLDEDERRIAEHPDDEDAEDDILAVREAGYPGDPILTIGKRRALREVEAKRRIVEDCAEYAGDEAVTDGLSARTLARLALPYADRPGYRDEWAPES